MILLNTSSSISDVSTFTYVKRNHVEITILIRVKNSEIEKFLKKNNTKSKNVFEILIFISITIFFVYHLMIFSVGSICIIQLLCFKYSTPHFVPKFVRYYQFWIHIRKKRVEQNLQILSFTFQTNFFSTFCVIKYNRKKNYKYLPEHYENDEHDQ